MGRFDNRVAIVTGAARGIGKATALRLAEEGARVAVLDFDESAAKAVVDEAGGKGLAFACDVTDRAQVEAAVDATAEQLGSVDILVNNAGITRDNLLFKMSDEDWDSVIATHLTGSFYATRATQRHMTKAGYGRIVFLSSRSAVGNRGQVNYAAAKAGIQGMVKTLAIELGPFGVTVNAVAPGFIETDMTRDVARRTGVSYEDLVKGVIERTPVRRTGKPADVAAAIAFFAAEESGFVSGQILYTAGGPVS